MIAASTPGFFADPTLRLLLAFLAGGGTAVLFGAAFLARQARRNSIARRLATVGLLVVALYGGTLLAVSAGSRERMLEPGERYTFSGFYPDPHLHAAVRGTRLARRLGPAGGEIEAKGSFAIVTLEFSSDARGSIQKPNRLRVLLVDQAGRRHPRSLAGEAALAAAQGDLGPLEQTLQPHTSYTRDLVFDLPAGTLHPRLRLWEGFWVDGLLELGIIEDDNSIGHAPVSLSLGVERI